MSPTLPKSYTAMQCADVGKPFKKVEVELKQPEEGEILVKILASGVCHSDSGVREGQMGPLPRIPGHEIVGDVVAVPESEKRFKVGDRVGSGWHGGHCGVCNRCRTGDFVTCENEAINGVSRDGGYAEYVLLRTEAVASIPTDIDPAEAAPLLCAGVTVFNSLRHMDILPGDIVAVQGIGGLGHLAIQYANRAGYRVVALSSSDKKKELATSLGAHDYVSGDQAKTLTEMGGAKVIICTAPSADVIKELISGLAVEGTLLILAISDDLTVPVLSLITKRLQIRGWPSGTAKDSEETIKFSQAQDITCQIEKYGLEDAEEAYQSMLSGKARFRAVLVPGYKKSGR